jgi:aldehyde dehydrogenase (NAD+)
MRVLFGKFFNCGQTCIGVDHLYVHESIKDKFKSILLSTAEQFYGNGQNIEDDGNYGKIINSLHVNRLERYLNDKHGGKIIYGGVIKK